MTASMPRWEGLLSPALVLSIVLALFASGCGDKAMTTQPLTPTPVPTKAPSAPSTVAMDVTLSPSNPPAGVKHAGLAVVVVREVGGRTVSLTSMSASGYYDGTPVHVAGFSPFVLAPRQASSFTVTLTSQEDFDCTEGVLLLITASDQKPATGRVGCETTDWPF